MVRWAIHSSTVKRKQIIGSRRHRILRGFALVWLEFHARRSLLYQPHWADVEWLPRLDSSHTMARNIARLEDGNIADRIESHKAMSIVLPEYDHIAVDMEPVQRNGHCPAGGDYDRRNGLVDCARMMVHIWHSQVVVAARDGRKFVGGIQRFVAGHKLAQL